MDDITRKVAEETLIFTSERGVFWERTRTLFIADTHWGGTHRTLASLADDLRRLSALITRFDTQRLIILGDMIDVQGVGEAGILQVISAWRETYAEIPISLVRGDQEREAGDPPLDLNIDVVNGPTPGPYFVLCHQPHQPEKGYAIAGHLHPAIMIDGHKIPCYRFGERCLTLPAFSDEVKCRSFDPAPNDEVIIIGKLP